MVTITERAKELLLQKKWTARINESEVGLRLKTGARGHWVLVPDRPKTGDEVVDHKGSTVLLVDAKTSEILSGRTVDCRKTAEGNRELIITPSATSPDARRRTEEQRP